MMEVEEDGGYVEDFVEELHSRYECPICCLVLREPLQLQCGHRFCQTCFEKLPKRETEEMECPIDRTMIKIQRVFEDVALKREILDLVVKCKNCKRSCEWTGELRDSKKHNDLCPYEDVGCTNQGCFDVIERRELQNHLGMQCQHRLVPCEHCGLLCKIIAAAEHVQNSCKRKLVECVNKCDNLIPREEMEKHMAECPLEAVPCSFADIGCLHMCRRFELTGHMESSLQHHLNIAVQRIGSLEVELEKQNKEFRETLVSWGTIIEDQRDEFAEKIQAIEARAKNHEKELTDKICKLEAQFKFYNDSNTSKEEPEMTRKRATQQSVEKRGGNYDMHVSCKSFIWEIRSYNRKLEDAKHIPKCEYSEPFYLKGYKFKLRAYLNGLDEYKNKAMSVFGQIMKGDYDEMLLWPFKERMLFTLQDQGSNPIVFDPQLCKAKQCFVKPATEYNDKFVCLLIPHYNITKRGYVKVDAISITVLIDP